MKITIFNRDNAGHKGGDMMHCMAYVKAFKEQGHDVEYSHAMYNVPAGDMNFLFHINFGWSWNQYRSLIQLNKQYSIIAIFYPHEFDVDKSRMREMMDGAKDVFCLSEVEKKELIDFTNYQYSSKIKVIPNGVDKLIFTPEGPRFEEPYVISAGRIECGKGHLNVIQACKKFNIPVKIVGARVDHAYYEERKNAYDKVEVIDWVGQETLAKYYRSAKVIVCASDSDRNNLTLLEGLACGCRGVSSPGNRGNEWLPGIRIAEPSNIDELAASIKLEYDGIDCKPYEFKIYSWDEIAKMIL